MKKTIATCLLLILILSCVFSFVACSDPIDPVVGKYEWTAPTIDTDSKSYWDIRANGTATSYSIFVNAYNNMQIGSTLEYTWTYDENTHIYTFKDVLGRYQEADEFILVDNTLKRANSNYSGSYGHRISDSEWPEILK
ncbi:MAG: hypothetical protein K2K85_04955 [Clostridia bacterium]|nr:hypothetical protein [Clostridia bacterium]